MMKESPDPNSDALDPAAGRLLLLASGIAVAFFFANDLLLTLPGSIWWTLDIGLRLAIVLLFLMPASSRHVLLPLFSFPGFLWTVGWVLACLVASLIGFALMRTSTGLFKFPELSSGWVLIDAAVGLPLVSLSEELVFRAAPLLLFARMRPVWWMARS
jgi:membrane protease YdiL (CAAX protease family)